MGDEAKNFIAEQRREKQRKGEDRERLPRLERKEKGHWLGHHAASPRVSVSLNKTSLELLRRLPCFSPLPLRTIQESSFDLYSSLEYSGLCGAAQGSAAQLGAARRTFSLSHRPSNNSPLLLPSLVLMSTPSLLLLFFCFCFFLFLFDFCSSCVLLFC